MTNKFPKLTLDDLPMEDLARWLDEHGYVKKPVFLRELDEEDLRAFVHAHAPPGPPGEPAA